MFAKETVYMRLRFYLLPLALFCSTVLSDVYGQRLNQDYYAQRLAELSPRSPSKLRKNSSAAKTHHYWQLAAGEIDICLDSNRMKSDLGYFKSLRVQYQLGPQVRAGLIALPREGVDPKAVEIVLHTEQNFERLRAISHGYVSDAAKFLLGDVTAGDPNPLDRDHFKAVKGVFSYFRDAKRVGEEMIRPWPPQLRSSQPDTV